jgi:hypothetical protein
MRLSIIIASAMVGLSFGYKYFVQSTTPTAKSVFSWSFILIMLSILGNTALANIADMIAYIIILIIVLNDGYEFVSHL